MVTTSQAASGINPSRDLQLGPLSTGEIKSSVKIPLSEGERRFVRITNLAAPLHAAPYELKLFFEPIQFSDFGEPNNTYSEAYKFPLDSLSLQATIGYNSDSYDYYKVSFPSNGLYKFQLKNELPSGIDGGAIYRTNFRPSSGEVAVEFFNQIF